EVDAGYFLDVALITLGNGMGERLIRTREQQENRRHEKQGNPLPDRSIAIQYYVK
ncbi:TPA: hypothetical protein SL553_006324, partial [Pseudomonas aeruginosa]|nr:hypothetical protein [Pseudomonas aeruginosa]